MAKRKPKSLHKLSEEAATLLQKKIKLKASDDQGYCECVTCQKRAHWSEMDGGHYVGRKWKGTKLLEENIHPQCKRCNGFLNGNVDEYALFMLDFYGEEFLVELRRLKHEETRWDRDGLLTMIQELKTDVQELESQLEY